MNKKITVRDCIFTAVKLAGGAGVAKIIGNIAPYEGPIGTICCYIAGAMIATASVDMIDMQLLKYEQILKTIANGDGMVTFM